MNSIKVSGVVVVGAGPAGITIAIELAKAGIEVLLAESGFKHFSEDSQSLSDLQEFDPARHAPMSIASRRQFGGATNIWGGRCVPFDPIDFEARPFVPHSDWPIQFDEVEKYYSEASEYFRCGTPIFSTHGLASIQQKTITPNLTDSNVCSSELERWSLPTNFGKEYRDEVLSNPRIRVLFGFSATKILLAADKGEVIGIEGVDSDGVRQSLVGANYVLACGGLETTRLLMQPTDGAPQGLGNQGDWLGRCYMGHISGQIANVKFSGDPKKTQFGFLRDEAGVYLRQRFTFPSEVQKKHEFNNIALWLVNPKIGESSHGNGVLSFAYLALRSPFGKVFAPEAIRKSAIADADGSVLDHALNMVRQFPKVAAFIPSFGVKRFLISRRIPGFFQYSAANEYPLHYHGEQIPNLESRVSLSEVRDRLGMQKLNVDLRFSSQDVTSVIRAHEILDSSLRDQCAGELEYFSDDLEGLIWDQAQDGYHQAGTTRMSKLPKDGVVDENCRVFGTNNLFVASSSNFVTSGQANSTFLIVALAIRLAHHFSASRMLNGEP